MSQYQLTSSTSSDDFVSHVGDDLMAPVMVKKESHPVDSAFVLGSVNECLKPVEVNGVFPSSEELPVEEIVFGNDSRVMLSYTGKLPASLRQDTVADDSSLPMNRFAQLPSLNLLNLVNGSNICSNGPLPSAIVNYDVDQPKVISDLLIFRCSLCNSEYFKEETGVKHLRRLHSCSDVSLVTRVARTIYVCAVCHQPFHDCYQCQWHMKNVHNVCIDGRLKSYSKFESFNRRHLVSWHNRRFELIECLICRSQMHLAESYYLHIRRHHRSDPQYKAAIKHLLHVREARLQKKCRMNIQCFKCDDVLTEYSIMSHLRVVHAADPCLHEMITTTKLCIKNVIKSQSLTNQKVKIRCQFCEKEMRNSTLKSHLEFHCPALIAVIPDGQIKQEVLESAAKRGAEAVLVRMPRTTTCSQCDKTMTLKTVYHHRRRVHGIGIKNAKTYSCSYCKKTFWDQYHLQNHLLIHTRDRAFVCLVCCRSFINRVSYTEHHRRVHERQFLHSCLACGRGFWKRVDKIRHICKPQDLSINQLKNVRLAAIAKSVMDKWEGPFYLEMERSEALKFISNATNFHNHLKQNNQQDDKKLVCVICKKSFQSIRYFQSHFRYSHLQDYDLTCELCGLGFWNVAQRTSHKCDPSKYRFNMKKRHLLASKTKEMLKTIPKPYYYVVGVTEQSVNNYPNLIQTDLDCHKVPCHAKSENNDETVDCLWEGAENVPDFRNDKSSIKLGNSECKRQDNISVEKTSGSVEERSSCTLCSICGKELKLKNYYPHMRRVHCDDSHKPIAWKICDQCGYKCQDNYKFRRHCLTHNKDAVGITCELCNRLFHELVDYNYHFKHRHLGQFNICCDLCGKGFWKINALQSHVCYPELKEENLRMQKFKAEAAIKKRDAIRKTTGMNSNIAANDNIQSLDQEVSRRIDPEEKNSRKKQNSMMNSVTSRVLIKQKDRLLRQPSKPTIQHKQPDCRYDDTNLVTTARECSFISESMLNNLASNKEEVKAQNCFKNSIKPGKPSTAISSVVSVRARKRTFATELKKISSVEEKSFKRQKQNKQERSESVNCHNKNIHQYGTRKRQISFRALLGKK